MTNNCAAVWAGQGECGRAIAFPNVEWQRKRRQSTRASWVIPGRSNDLRGREGCTLGTGRVTQSGVQSTGCARVFAGSCTSPSFVDTETGSSAAIRSYGSPAAARGAWGECSIRSKSFPKSCSLWRGRLPCTRPGRHAGRHPTWRVLGGGPAGGNYQCAECGWRGWTLPKPHVHEAEPEMGDGPPDLEAIDLAIASSSAGRRSPH